MSEQTLQSYARGFRQRSEAVDRERRDRANAVMEAVPDMERVLSRYPEVERAYLFGSVVEGKLTRRSDVDLAVRGSLAGRFFDLWRELDEVTPTPVDLVALDDQSPTFQSHVQQFGKLIYERCRHPESSDR